MAFAKRGSTVGSISVTGTATQYNTSSDYRLKEDFQPIATPIEKVKQLKPVNFAWKADRSRVDGFIAHELAEVIPEAVTGEKDAMKTVVVKRLSRLKTLPTGLKKMNYQKVLLSATLRLKRLRLLPRLLKNNQTIKELINPKSFHSLPVRCKRRWVKLIL